ncbi:MAG: DsrE/DsrF/DrsH-like family protein [Gammaproteobacteria bacterium]|nr:DsrE/DsrF/DrsH-like family protein [Gammaproteobacteria bacterium]
MKSMTIIVREDSYDKILTPLAFAYLQASEGIQVDMLFVNWSVRALTEEGAKNIKVQGEHADKDQWVRDQVEKAGIPNDIYTLIKAIKEMECVNFYGCSLAAAVFGVDEGSLIPEAEGIVGASWFLNEKADKADYNQTF